MKRLIVMCHVISMSVGIVMSTTQTARILKTGNKIRWTSVFGGFFVMIFALALVTWNRDIMLKKLR